MAGKRRIKTKVFQFRLSEPEHAMLAAQAAQLGMSISEYIRLLIQIREMRRREENGKVA